MLFPKKVKHRKWQTGRKNPKRFGVESRGVRIDFGAYALKALEGGRIDAIQIEAARKVVSRFLGKTGKVWIRVFPDRPYTAKAPEVGMGQGKGDPEGYCADVRPGRIVFEVDGVSRDTAREALRKAGTKLPLKTRTVERGGTI
jgi:large subunit ribosomal protein L16